jgi:hypothetical protein
MAKEIHTLAARHDNQKTPIDPAHLVFRLHLGRAALPRCLVNLWGPAALKYIPLELTLSAPESTHLPCDWARVGI